VLRSLASRLANCPLVKFIVKHHDQMVVGSEMDIDVVGSVSEEDLVAYINPNPNLTICLPASGIIFQHKIQMEPNNSYFRVSLNCAGCGKKALNELDKYLLAFGSTSRSPTTITINN
jgi:hypothetical protein